MLLTNQYQDYEAAQAYFMKALESDPRNAEACQHAHGYWRGTAGAVTGTPAAIATPRRGDRC